MFPTIAAGFHQILVFEPFSHSLSNPMDFTTHAEGNRHVFPVLARLRLLKAGPSDLGRSELFSHAMPRSAGVGARSLDIPGRWR
jgi:hypothetical protein